MGASRQVPASFSRFFFEEELTYNTVLVSGVHCKYVIHYTSRGDHRSKPSDAHRCTWLQLRLGMRTIKFSLSASSDTRRGASNRGSRAACHVPRTEFSYNRRFVPVTPVLHFPTRPTATILFSVSVSLIFCVFASSDSAC